MVSGAAFAAVLVVGVPVGLEVGDAVSRGDGQFAPATPGPQPSEGPTSGPSASAPEWEITGPTQVSLDLAELPTATEPPFIPYVDGRTIVMGDWSIDVPGKQRVTAVAPFLTGAHVLLNDGGSSELVSYLEGGQGEVVGAAAGVPLATADLRWNAYAVGKVDEFGNNRPGLTLTVFDSQEFTFDSIELPAANYVDFYAIADGTVYFRPHAPGGGEPPLQTWTPGQDAPTTLPLELRASAVSADGQVVAEVTEVTDSGSCSHVVELASGQPLWETCDHQIRGFSPDRSFAWAGPGYADGYAPARIAILDAETGTVIRKLQGPEDFDRPVFFMNATFEDEDHLLIQAEQDSQTALVRCTVSTGDCELAVPLAAGTSLETGSPYLLSSQ